MASKKKKSPPKAKKAAPRPKASAKSARPAKAAKKASPKSAVSKKASPKKAPPKKALLKRAPPKPVGKKAKASLAKRGTVPSLALDRALEAATAQGVMARLSPPVQPLVSRLRQLMLESAPEAVEMLQQQNPAYYAQGVFARIEPKEREVMVRFLRGSRLPSGAGLAGDGENRDLVVTAEDLKTSLLTKLVREAVSLNLRLVGQEPQR
jgi:hypothetical protein